MSDVDRLLSHFEDGSLIRPGEGRATTVDLIRALYRLCGATGIPANAHVRALEQAIGVHDHYLFVIIDGLGSEIAGRCGGEFLTAHRHQELRPVFPSTTAAAMTTFATATWPAEHGVTSWWIYLEEHDVSATILPFVERYSGESLLLRGVEPFSAFPTPSLWTRLAHAPTQIIPEEIADSVYSQYMTGGERKLGYASPEEAFDLARQDIAESLAPTLTWLYLPGVDGKAHVHGVESEEVAREVELYETLLEETVVQLDGKARIIVTADHGLADVPDEARHQLTADDPLLDLLKVPPTGEPVVPIFHVKAGRADQFAREFRARFSKHFALLTLSEVEELRLLGPDPLAPVTEARLGDFVGIALHPATLNYQANSGGSSGFRAYHAGLSPREMSVPLLLA